MASEKEQQKVEKRHSDWVDKHWACGAPDKFQWTQEKMERLFAVNDGIIQKENELYKLLASVKNDLDALIASGHSYYENYSVDAYLDYEPPEDSDYETPTGDSDTMRDVCFCTDFDLCNELYASAGEPLGSLEEKLRRDTNYNWTWPFRELPDQDHYITRYLYTLLERGTYTLDDILYLNPEWFTPRFEVRN